MYHLSIIVNFLEAVPADSFNINVGNFGSS